MQTARLFWCWQTLPAVRPYNRAAGLSMTRPKVRVISGLNSSMLMDLCMRNITGDECPDVDALAADIMQTGHENIGKFVLEVPAQPPGGRGRYLKGETP